jgi:surface antigen
LVSLALMGGVALATGARIAPAPPVAHADAADAVRSWLTFDRPELCESWQSPTRFVRHCTTSWYLDVRGRPVSGDPAWVPLEGDLLGASENDLLLPHALLLSSLPRTTRQVKHNPARPLAAAPSWSASAHWVAGSGGSGSSSGPYGLWTPPPGHPAYGMSDYPGDPNAAYFGYCTWYAQYRRQDERLINLGNAGQWAFNAPSHGLRSGTAPAVGATVVFQPGVEGASGLGHVAHVEAVYSGGWFLISEMNMGWNGGGWGRVSYRYAVTGPGVSFVY